MPWASHVRAVQPTQIFEIIHRAAAEVFEAVGIFIDRFAQMRMAGAIVLVGQLHRFHHQPLGDGERRAGRQRHLQHRTFGLVVILADHPFAIGQNRIIVLHDGIWRQAAILFRQAHGPTRQGNPHTQLGGFLGLNVHRVFQTARKKILMVRHSGAAAHQQFRQRKPCGEAKGVRRHVARPDRVERLKPGKQFLVDRRRMGPRQRLEEMVVRVDETRQHDMTAGVEDTVRMWRRTGGHQFHDAPVFDNDATSRTFGKNGKRGLDPKAHGHVFHTKWVARP